MIPSYLNWRSSGIWDWAVWVFCWVCFSLFQFPACCASCHFPCAGFFSCSASTTGAFADLGSCCAWFPPCGGHTEVVSGRLNPRNSTIDVGEICNFLSSVSSQQKFETTDWPVLQSLDGLVLQLPVTAQFYLESKEKWILEVWGKADPKDTKRRESPSPILGPLFMFFFFFILPWPCLIQIGLARSAFYFTWGPHSGVWTFLCSIFEGFSFPCLLATAILDSFFLF